MRNTLTRLADGRPDRSYHVTIIALYKRKAIKLENGRMVPTPAGLAAIGRTV